MFLWFQLIAFQVLKHTVAKNVRSWMYLISYGAYIGEMILLTIIAVFINLLGGLGIDLDWGGKIIFLGILPILIVVSNLYYDYFVGKKEFQDLYSLIIYIGLSFWLKSVYALIGVCYYIFLDNFNLYIISVVVSVGHFLAVQPRNRYLLLMQSQTV